MALKQSIKYSLLFYSCFAAMKAIAQDNYEIQVYASPTTKKGSTMFELHSNYNFGGT
ncbi:hypothetical protein [Parasediminibacterium sp. JCM 36343]|uniref:hypothetical protein n=1 Tax=Parasediminibacterium sp. JCM 36343 TaxID=3374279 RepID=UPI0039789FB0